MGTTEINGITYNIKAEVEIIGENIIKACNGFYVSTLILVRPKGNKEFWATRNTEGVITLN